jgi:hypothetical protein
MCSPRLSYLYLSSFLISAVSVYPCAPTIPFAYDHHRHFFILEEKQKAYSHTFRPVLSCPVLSFVKTMCIVCFGLTRYHPALDSLASFLSLLFHCFICECDGFNFGLPLVASPQHRDDIVRNEALMRLRKRLLPLIVVRLMVKPHCYSLSNLSHLSSSLSSRSWRGADMAIILPTPRRFPFLESV